MDLEVFLGVEVEVHHDAAGFVDYVVEIPPVDGLPEIIWIFDEDDPPLLYNIQAVDPEEGPEVQDPEEEEDEDWADWDTSEDSGYGSLDEDEEDLEDVEEEDVRPPFPLVQPLPPPAGAPVIAGPAAPPQEDPAAPIVSLPKRPREESDEEDQVGTKRQRTSEEDDEQPGPSTSGAASSTNHSASGPSTSPQGFSAMIGNWARTFWSPDDSDSD